MGVSGGPGEAAEQRRGGRTKRRPDRAAKRGVETAGGGRLQGDRRWNAKAGGGLADHLARLEQAIVAAEAQIVGQAQRLVGIIGPHQPVEPVVQRPPLQPQFLGEGLEPQIGSASCRERVCQYVYHWVVAVSLKKK